MKKNVGSYDAAVRFVVGCGLLVMFNHNYGSWCLLGLVPIVTATIGFCPAYRLFRFETTSCDTHEHHI